MSVSASSRLERRYDLDWLRIGALALLILTHTNYIFTTWGWRGGVHSLGGGLFGDLIFDFLAPWRMGLVFLIAGAATRFMLEKHDLAAFIRNRTLRLVVPFLFGVLVLVPPILFIARGDLREHGFLSYLEHDTFNVISVYGIPMPDLMHVWFLPYVFAYGLVACLAWRFARTRFQQAERLLASAPVAFVVGGLTMLIFLSTEVVEPVFPRSNMLVDDPASHLHFLPAFLLGLLLVRSANFWAALRAARIWLYPLAAGMAAVFLVLVELHHRAAIPAGPLWYHEAARALYGATMIFALLALASTTLNRTARGHAYLSDAIMPAYLLHYPVLMMVAKVVLTLHLPMWIEYPLILSLVYALCMGIYHVAIRPFAPIRFLFGLKPDAAGKPRGSMPREAAGTTG
jgi:glucan biosynthesis protein C